MASAKPKMSFDYGTIATHVAVLETQTSEMSTRFDYITTRFEKILDRVEQLTLSTTTLIAQHDNQIMELQKQMARTEEILKEGNQQLATTLASVTKKMDESLAEFKEMYSVQHKAMDRRVGALERARWMLLGAGGVAGFLIGNTDKLWNFWKTITAANQ